MMRSALLTLRMHRFEVLFAAGLMALTGISASIAGSHAEAANLPQSCWDQWYQTSGGIDMISSECQGLLFSFWSTTEEAGFVAAPIAMLLPWIVGLLLGVPVVGKELETGTATLAWSLTGRRAHWLTIRFLPMFVLALTGSAVVGVLVAQMADAAEPFNRIFGAGRLPDLGDLGREGVTLVSRTVAAFGVGLLSGAIVGRTLSGFAIGAVVSLVLFLGLGPGLQLFVAEQVATWAPSVDRDEVRTYNLSWLGNGYVDASGEILSDAQVEALWEEECPECGDRNADDEQGERVLDRFLDWRSANFTRASRTVAMGAYDDFERAETISGLTVGTVFILLTFPVVSRRRPS